MALVQAAVHQEVLQPDLRLALVTILRQEAALVHVLVITAVLLAVHVQVTADRQVLAQVRALVTMAHPALVLVRAQAIADRRAVVQVHALVIVVAHHPVALRQEVHIAQAAHLPVAVHRVEEAAVADEVVVDADNMQNKDN